MKHYISICIAAVLLFCITATTSAQESKDGWKEKMESEKIAFLTQEIGLTPEEAQTFWPVYNQVGKEIDAAYKKIVIAFKTLDTAIKENKSEKEISALLDDYINAKADKNRISEEATARFRQVLSAEQLAKFYLADEHFRRKQIHKLHHQHKK